MSMQSRTLVHACLAAACLTGVAVALAQPQGGKDGKAAQPPMLPPGWTEADMMACVEAGTPGPKHQHLGTSAGVWTGTNTMWMAPGTEPMKTDVTSTVKMIMDGRYQQVSFEGDMPGMGPFSGMGLNGYDNVSQKFQSVWIDNHGTGMMVGTGELSADGKTMTWTYAATCPITKKPTTMREIDKITGKDTMTMEMHGTDPKSGKEYKMMEIALKRKS
jgi:hypothetical protein